MLEAVELVSFTVVVVGVVVVGVVEEFVDVVFSAAVVLSSGVAVVVALVALSAVPLFVKVLSPSPRTSVTPDDIQRTKIRDTSTAFPRAHSIFTSTGVAYNRPKL